MRKMPMKKIPRLVRTLKHLLLPVFLLFLFSRVQAAEPEVSSRVLLKPAVENTAALEVEDDVCLECHDDFDRTLSGTTHRLASTIKSPSVIIGCVSCHSGGPNHIEDPTTENITNPAGLVGKEAFRTCTKCHMAHVEMDNLGFDVHFDQQINCAGCHSVHGGGKSLLLDDRAEFCFRCHVERRSKFSLRSNHPVQQGNVTCLSCHRMTKRQDYNVAYDLDRTCQGCHPEQGGPFPFEHEATTAYDVEGAGCMACHDPHGSENDHLLQLPAERVCLQCHPIPAGHRAPNGHGGIGTQHTCQTCHDGHHGSYTSDIFISPDLTEQIGIGLDCSATQCHGLTGRRGN